MVPSLPILQVPKLPERLLAEVARQVVAGLAHLHSKLRIVHRCADIHSRRSCLQRCACQ